MGKRKKGKLGSEIGTKRMRLRSSGSLTESDLEAELMDHRKTDSSKTSNHRTVEESQHVGISYREAKRIMAAEAASSLAAVAEKRHITIGWHQMGKAADAIKYILKFSLGQYRNSLDGVLLAIGKVVVDKPLCIADQLCMHVDLTVNSVVFRPEKDHIYKCLVTAADKKFVTAKLYNTITFFASLKNSKKPPNIGDEVLIKFSRIEIKGSLCQMKGTIA